MYRSFQIELCHFDHCVLCIFHFIVVIILLLLNASILYVVIKTYAIDSLILRFFFVCESNITFDIAASKWINSNNGKRKKNRSRQLNITKTLNKRRKQREKKNTTNTGQTKRLI